MKMKMTMMMKISMKEADGMLKVMVEIYMVLKLVHESKAEQYIGTN